MNRLLLDTDAFLCLRNLGVLAAMCDVTPCRGAIVLTEFVAYQELSSLRPEIDAWVRAGSMTVHPVLVRARKALLDGRGRNERMHKGEAEAITFALSQPPASRPVFVSSDADARKAAERRAVPSFDVLDAVVAAVECGCILIDLASRSLSIWDDKTQQQCRPGDWRGFASTFPSRRDRVRSVVGLAP